MTLCLHKKQKSKKTRNFIKVYGKRKGKSRPLSEKDKRANLTPSGTPCGNGSCTHVTLGGVLFRSCCGTTLAKKVQRDTFLASCVIEDVVPSVLRVPSKRLIFFPGTEFAHTLRKGHRRPVDLLDSVQEEVNFGRPLVTQRGVEVQLAQDLN